MVDLTIVIFTSSSCHLSFHNVKDIDLGQVVKPPMS